MELLIKVCGFLIIILTSTSAGFFKSIQLKSRKNKLMAIYRSVSELKERIRLGGGEINRIVKQSFDEKFIYYENNSFYITKDSLTQQDVTLINEFFDNLGMSDTKAECERAELYLSLISKQHSIAEQKCDELCKLYNSLGFLFGVFICIFFL